MCFFGAIPNMLLNKQSSDRWFDTQRRSYRITVLLGYITLRHIYIYIYIYIYCDRVVHWWLYINLCCLLCRRSIMVSEAITWGQNTAQIINQTPGYSQYRAENAATMAALSDADDHETATGWLPTYIAITFMIAVLTITQTEIVLFDEIFYHWLYGKLLKWQLPLQPVAKI